MQVNGIRNFTIAAVAAAATVFSVSAGAQQIVVVDMDFIGKESVAAKSVREQVQKRGATLLDSYKRQENEIIAAYDDLAKQRPLLAPEAFSQRRRDLDQKKSDFQQRVQMIDRQVSQAGNDAIRQVDETMREVVREYATEKKAELVLLKGVTLYAGKTVDITAEVLKRLDKKLPTVVVNFPK
ncbi:MAG: OmpH family outer membrane protein [Rhodospirillaceae bacterium]|nr:OmpH family outer membrane protein [Rhodospirillaceae bacterium]